MPLDPNEALTREPFKPETWPVDADGFQPDLCTDCGTPVRYGSRHGRCLEPARAPGAQAVMLNGLTQAETAQTASVAGLAQAAPAAVAEPSTPIHWPLNEDQARMAFWGSYPDTGDSTKSEVWMTAYRWCRALAAAPAAAQPVAQEAVGYTAGIKWHPKAIAQSEQVVKITRNPQPEYGFTTALYTTPPALVGLSDEQIDQIGNGLNGIDPPISRRERDRRIARAALAAANGMTLREGGNG